MTDFMKDYKKREEERLKKAKDILKEVCILLEGIGITRIEAIYDGEGDSGAVQDVLFYCKDVEYKGKLPKNKFKPVSEYINPPEDVDIKEIIEDICCHFLPDGWEINDGSFGNFQIDTKTKMVTLQHNDRYTEVTTTEEEIAL